MKRSASGKWLIVVAIAGCCALFLTLGLSGCSSAATAAQSAAQSAAASVAAAVTQPSTVANMASTVATTQSASSSQGIWGRWILKGQVIQPDGTVSTGLVQEIAFHRNGTFMSQTRDGVSSLATWSGKFKLSGSVLTTNMGNTQQTFTYQVKGSQLALTNSKSHQTTIYQRR